MREHDSLVLRRERFPAAVSVGQEFYVRVKGRVRRIEAEHIDVSGFDRRGATAVLEGDVAVELTVLAVEVSP